MLHFRASAEPTVKFGVRMNMAAASACELSAALLNFQASQPDTPWFVISCHKESGVKRSMVIDTLGALWPCALLITENEKFKLWFAAVFPVRLNTNCPSFDQFPVEGRGPLVTVRGKLELEAVVVPISPRSVIVGRPATLEEDDLHVSSSGKGVCSSTVMIFVAHGQGVLWLAIAKVHDRVEIFIGAKSFSPYVMVLVDE